MSKLFKPPRYLFLMRHAQHRAGHLTNAGSANVRELAGRLSEWIFAEWRNEPDRAIRLWYTAPATEVRETVNLLMQEVLAETQRPELRVGYPFSLRTPNEPAGATRPVSDRQSWSASLLPSFPKTEQGDFGLTLSAYSPDDKSFRELRKWLDASKTHDQARRTDVDAPLVVGNDPLIGWLATKLSRRTTPVSRGEFICLVRKYNRGRWRLLWTISEDGEAEAEAIRTKIKSKMNTAAALGTVIVGLTTFLLQEAFKKEPSVWHWLAFATLGAAAALYFLTLFLYDTLQMPPRFWGSRFPSRTASQKKREMPWSRFRHGKPSVRRPPSSTARVLQANMVQIWTWIFTPPPSSPASAWLSSRLVPPRWAAMTLLTCNHGTLTW
jgi:hypothetical protein